MCIWCRDRYAAGPSPLAGLYFTDWHEDASLDPVIAPMPAIDAMMRLRRDMSLAHLVELLGQEQDFLSWAAGPVPLARHILAFATARATSRVMANAWT
jgi:hypothetical protein